MSATRPRTPFVFSGKDRHDPGRDPDACFILIPTERSPDHSPNTHSLQGNKSFLRILQLNSGEGKKKGEGINFLVVVGTEQWKGASCCRCWK